MANKYFLDLEGTKTLIQKIVGMQRPESDPIFSASPAANITSTDISNWNSKTDNIGTVTGITMNSGSTLSPTNGIIDLGTVLTSETGLSKGTTTGTGNAVTDISVSEHEITLTKGSTFVTDSDLASYADGVEYDATNSLIYLKHGNTRLANPISATPFITDGMVSNVNIATVASGINVGKICLIITFNTDSGKSPIEIPISQIFDADNYYTKTEIDNSIEGLPTVTSADNGKILRVVNGVWSLVDPVTLYSGAGTPNNSQGNNGDLYLQI